MTTNPPPKKQFILNAFAMQTPCHLNPGLYRYPNDTGRSYTSLQTWLSLAQKLESAKFHAIFFADVLGGYDVYKGPGNLDPAIASGAQFPLLDPLYSISALAAATRSIGFGVTASTTYEAPYALARRFSTVDHLSQGRVGWNVVTSYLESAARNFGLEGQISRDERYKVVDEYMDVVYKLWEGSWREDAVRRDGNGYADPRGVRRIEHQGEYFRVPGPHICEPSPQRTPFILQAGTSSSGKAFAAKHAEAIFVNGHKPELVRPSVDGIRQQAVEFGRDPRDIKFVAGVLVIVAETNETAKAKFAELSKYGDPEGALALFGGWSGFDMNKYPDDQDFRFVGQPAVAGMVNHWASDVPESEGKKWDKKAITEYLSISGNGAKIIGDAKTVADELERWIEVADVDGFNLSYASIPETFDDIIEYLIPELQARGVFWTDYAVPGGTLRENMYGKAGQTRLPKEHYGAQYTWNAGEEAPQYTQV